MNEWTLYRLTFPLRSLLWRLRGLCGSCGEEDDACYCKYDTDEPETCPVCHGTGRAP